MIRPSKKLSTLYSNLVNSATFTLAKASSITPKTCNFCGLASQNQFGACEDCYQELPWNSECCSRCALPLPSSRPLCGECLKTSPSYSMSICPATYEFPIDSAIHRWKYKSRRRYTKTFAQMLFNALENHYYNADLPEVIIPVPVDPKRIKSRMLDHTNHLAKALSKLTAIPYKSYVIKHRSTPSQTEKSKTERRKMLRDCFSINTLVTEKKVALLDDVITTGTTAEIISQQLLNAGAEQVDVWAVARTPKQ